MKSGGPWNLRGLRPQAREAERDAAQEPGSSLGEWLNRVVRSSEDKAFAEDLPRDERRSEKSRYRRDRIHRDARRIRYEGRPYRDDCSADHEDHRSGADERRQALSHRRRDDDHYPPRSCKREEAREVARDAARREEPRMTGAPAEARRETAHEDSLREEGRQEATREEETRRKDDHRDAPPKAAHRDEAREEAVREDERLQAVREEARAEAARARKGLGDMNARLDQLARQLDRLAHAQAARQRAVLARLSEPAAPRKLQLTGAPPQPRRTKPEPVLSIEDAVAEITARQRVLDNAIPAPTPSSIPDPAFAPEAASPVVTSERTAPATSAVPRPADAAEAEALASGAVHKAALDAVIVPPAPSAAPPRAANFSSLEAQLRQITARIEALQPASDIEKTIAAVRTDLAEISRQIREALPRRAVESLEIEVKALGERIDHSRQCGVDPNVLGGLERGLAEVRDALRALTPAENLVGFDETVKTLWQRLEAIPAGDDPSALQQLEAAIGGLRGVVSHVASNDTLTRLAEDVRALASQVDRIANSAATGQAVSALEQRIDTLAAALTASNEADQAVPRDLQQLLAGIVEKLEWLQRTQPDQAPLAQLEDRIASLSQRFDASNERLGHLDAIERGLADLLGRIEEIGGARGVGVAAATLEPPALQAIERHVAEIKQNEYRTQDKLESVQGTVAHLVDRLAAIESNLHRDTAPRAGFAAPSQAAPEPAPAPAPREAQSADLADEPQSLSMPASAAAEEPAPRSAGARLPIDPTLPPDHPLEPRPTSARGRPPSAAERIADSEAAIGLARPPVISDAERPNFIAAARRAAQAAAREPPRQKLRVEAAVEQSGALRNKLSRHLRKLIVAGSIVLIVVGCIRIATKLVAENNSGAAPSTRSGQTAPTAESPQAILPPKQLPSATPALPLPHPAPSAPSNTAAPTNTAPQPTTPGRQSMRDEDDEAGKTAVIPPGGGKAGARAAMPSWAVPDITGALPSPQTAPAITPAADEVAADHKLPPTIGNPALRKAAMAGDPAAAYEIATRFAEGRGVLQNNEEAAYWLQQAARQGLAAAQFRLGSLYERGVGVNKDLATARDLYLAAAEQGNGNAMHNLAVLSAEGVNGPPDYKTAAGWFRKAADRGIRDSQYNLGILYARGIGVQQDNAASYKWFALAAKQGDKDAASKRDEIASHLDAKSLAAARLAVQNWSPEPQGDDAIHVKKTAAAWSPAATAAPPTKPQ